MSAIQFLIAFSLLVALGFLFAFLWAVRTGQFDDLHTPSFRMLWDDDHKIETNSSRHSDSKEK